MMDNQHIWFFWSFGLVLIWWVVYLIFQPFRPRMLRAGLFTMPFGLTEPLFVPEYWNPPSLFSLAQRTGFDVESLLFCFAIGGLAIIFYDVFFKISHETMSWHERHEKRHRLHFFTLVSPILFFLIFHFLLKWNPIYSGSTAMFLGGLTALWCRPDLKAKIWIGGLIFLVFYFIYFFLLDVLHPGYIFAVWNLSAISGIMVIGVPLEELIFAFTFGMLWSSYYEHLNWQKIKKNR